MKKFLFFAAVIITICSCSNSNSELNDRYSELDKKTALMLDFKGVRDKITSINPDTASRRSFTDMVVKLIPSNFAFLNNEITYLNSIKETPENKDILNKYKDRIKDNLSQHIKIYRLIFIKLAEKNVDNWGQLTIEGDNYDIIKQKCDKASDKEALMKFLPDMTDMRFKKVISTYNNSETITEIQSAADSELNPVKL
jgi:hypothetical protein